jgi:hypothetical protein
MSAAAEVQAEIMGGRATGVGRVWLTATLSFRGCICMSGSALHVLTLS